MSCADVANVVGRRLLFLGVDTANWTITQFQNAAKFARAHGINSLLVKYADGGVLWYGGLNGFRAIRDAIKAQGVGVVPYFYSYGDKYAGLDTEIANMITYMNDNGVICMDAEVEWNGQVAWAQQLATKMKSVKGIFLVSTWANPEQQAWSGVIQALNPVVSSYMPQQYTTYLASCWAQFGALGAQCLIPTVDISNEFGANDPVSIAKQAHSEGHVSISAWYYGFAVQNPSLLDSIMATYPETTKSTNTSTTTTTTQEGGEEMLSLTDAVVKKYFVQGPTSTSWRCTTNGVVIQDAILTFYRTYGGPAVFGLPLSKEMFLFPQYPQIAIVPCERAIIIFDPDRKVDNPPIAGQCYLLHIDKGVGQQMVAQSLIKALNTQITNLDALLKTANAQIATLQDTSALENEITSLKNRLAQVVQIASAA